MDNIDELDKDTERYALRTLYLHHFSKILEENERLKNTLSIIKKLVEEETCENCSICAKYIRKFSCRNCDYKDLVLLCEDRGCRYAEEYFSLFVCCDRPDNYYEDIRF